MNYRYRLTLRPLSQMNLNRLGYVQDSFRAVPEGTRYNYGSFATERQLTDFEVSQMDLIYEGEETR